MINESIWFLNCDEGHAFSHWHVNIKYNLLVMVFLWLLDEAGNDDKRSNPDDPHAYERYQFWGLFVQAWLGWLRRDYSYDAQRAFLNVWHTSGLDLIVFSSTSQRKIKDAMKNMKASMPEFPYGDPMKLIDMCMSADIDMTAIDKHGAALALQFLNAHIENADDIDKELVDAAKRHREAQKAQKDARLEQARASLASLSEASKSTPTNEIDTMQGPNDDYNVDFKGVEFTESEEVHRNRLARGEAMGSGDSDMLDEVIMNDGDADDNVVMEEPVLSVDVSRVKWDQGLLAGLLSVGPGVDIKVKLSRSKRPPTTRKGWMDEREAVALIQDNVHCIAGALDAFNL